MMKEFQSVLNALINVLCVLLLIHAKNALIILEIKLIPAIVI